jgi:nitroreductase
VFPRDFDPVERVDDATVTRLLEAAMWAPFHGPVPPWRFVVLARDDGGGIDELLARTVAFYDRTWPEHWASEREYAAFREKKLDRERWSAVSFMIAIVARRQAGSKRMAEWEEHAATACAVQNMQIQATAERDVACYWSSWHKEFRDSDDMAAFLRLDKEDRCFGVLVVAKLASAAPRKDLRTRTMAEHVEWFRSSRGQQQ